MAGWTDYAEEFLLRNLVGIPYAPSLSLHLGTNAGTTENPSITELSGDGYAAVSLSGLFSAAATTTYTYAPCGGGGFLLFRSTARVNADLTFPVATATWTFDTVALHDGMDYLWFTGASGPVNAGYRVRIANPAIALTLDWSTYVSCPTVLTRGNLTQLGQRKLLDNLSGVAPWTPTTYLGITNHISVPTEEHYAAAGFSVPVIDGSGRASADLNAAVDLPAAGNVASTFALGGLLALYDGADYTQKLAEFGATPGTGGVVLPTLNSGDFLRVATSALFLRVAD